MSEIKRITISEVLECIDSGMKRTEIAEHFNISMTECNKMFQHPLLKGRRAKKQESFLLVDDISTEEEAENNAEESSVITEEPTPVREEVEEQKYPWDN